MSLAQDLKLFGAPETSIRWLDEPSYDNLDYRDLVEGIALERGGSKDVKPAAVIEVDHQPLLYLIPFGMMGRAHYAADEFVDKLRIKLASRGNGAYVGISEPGKLTIYSIGLGISRPTPIVKTTGGTDSAGLYSELAAGLIELHADEDKQQLADRDAFQNKLFELLTWTSTELLKLNELNQRKDDVLSLIGRALFARFLIDRGILTTLPNGEAGMACFSSPSNAVETCRWMDTVFNGDLLKLADPDYEAFFARLEPDHRAYFLLTNVVRGTFDGQTELPFAFWSEIDFSHVPVGLLSEVYERLAHLHADIHAKAESIHYTPRNIAAYMVDQAFSGLAQENRATACCLDPAVGGGVFLVLCFRRIVAEKWRADGKAPSRKGLRDIIDKQIRGFDINESALKLAALSLYLSAIELDPDPQKAGDQTFEPMQGRVFTHARSDSEPHPNSFVLGSLGPIIPESHRSKYDIVIGNPPWTAWPRKKAEKQCDLLNKVATDLARQIAKERSEMTTGDSSDRLRKVALSYEHPGADPDLPFVWRAMEWAKTGGVIALALHARLLFQPALKPGDPRNALFSALRITGILNGSTLRGTNIWPNITAPWCLVFALNEIPSDEQLFYFVSPDLDPAANSAGRLRIDYGSAEPIEFGVLRDKPYLLKTLYRGTTLDAAILDRVLKVGKPLRTYIESHGLKHGDGVQMSLETTSGKLKDSTFLQGLPYLSAKTLKEEFALKFADLPIFNYPKVRRPKTRDLFRAPLLLAPESIRPNRSKRGSLLAQEDLVFTESFYGYSGYGYKHGAPVELIRYLHALTYSALFYHFTLMISSKFGVERDLINKHDFDSFPVMPFEELSSKDKRYAQRLSEEIEKGNGDLKALDQWVGRIYGLDEKDIDVLLDALETAMPFSAARKRSTAVTTAEDRRTFALTLAEQLNPLVKMINRQLVVTPTAGVASSWKFVFITARAVQPAQWAADWVEKLADDEGASAVFFHHEGGLILGMRDAYRYWTKSRARLLSHEIVAKHLDQVLALGPQ